MVPYMLKTHCKHTDRVSARRGVAKVTPFAPARHWQAAPKRGPKKEAPQPHPVLGYLIADLKYKRVYRTSVEAITRAPVWEKPRTLRPVHAMEIAEAKYLKRNVVRNLSS